MSREDGNLSLKIGFEIDKDALEKLINESVVKFQRKFASGVHSSSKVDWSKTSDVKKRLFDYTGPSSFTRYVRKSLDEILSILRSKKVIDTIVQLSHVGTGISPVKKYIPRTTLLPYPEQDEILKSRPPPKDDTKITTILDNFYERLQSDIEEPETRTVMEKGDALKTEHIKKFGRGSIKQFQLERERLFMSDEGYRKQHPGMLQYYNEASDKWQDLYFGDIHPLINKLDTLTSSDIVVQMAKAAKAVDVLKLINTPEGKKILDKILYVRAGMTDEGTVSFEFTADIEERAHKQIEKFENMIDSLSSHISKGMKSDIYVYKKLTKLFLDLFQGGATYSGFDVKDVTHVNIAKEALRTALIVKHDIDNEMAKVMSESSVVIRRQEISREMIGRDKSTHKRRVGIPYTKKRDKEIGELNKLGLWRNLELVSGVYAEKETDDDEVVHELQYRLLKSGLKDFAGLPVFSLEQVPIDKFVSIFSDTKTFEKAYEETGGRQRARRIRSDIVSEINKAKDSDEEYEGEDDDRIKSKWKYDYGKDVVLIGEQNRMLRILYGASDASRIGEAGTSRVDVKKREDSEAWHKLNETIERGRLAFGLVKRGLKTSKRFQQSLIDDPSEATEQQIKGLNTALSRWKHAEQNTEAHLWKLRLEVARGDNVLTEVLEEQLFGTPEETSIPYVYGESHRRDYVRRKFSTFKEKLIGFTHSRFRKAEEREEINLHTKTLDDDVTDLLRITYERDKENARLGRLDREAKKKLKALEEDTEGESIITKIAGAAITAGDISIEHGIRASAEFVALTLIESGFAETISDEVVKTVQTVFFDRIEEFSNILEEIISGHRNRKLLQYPPDMDKVELGG